MNEFRLNYSVFHSKKKNTFFFNEVRFPSYLLNIKTGRNQTLFIGEKEHKFQFTFNQSISTEENTH